MMHLGLAYRAKKVIYGTTNVIKTIQNKSAKLVIIASDASQNTQKKILDKCTFYSVESMIGPPSKDMSKAIGKVGIMVVSILDSGFVKHFYKKE